MAGGRRRRGSPRRPRRADAGAAAGDAHAGRATGRPLRAEDQRVLAAFAAQAAVVRERRAARRAGRRGRRRSPRPTGCAPPCSPRSATTCAARWPRRRRPSPACAAATIRWTDEERAELLATADESLDRLTRLIENLLDMSRLQAGALAVIARPVALDELVPRAARRPRARRRTTWPSTSPRPCRRSIADAALLERVLANLLANALRHSPPGRPPTARGERARRPGRDPRRRPRARRRPEDAGADVPAVPAARRPGQHHRRRARPRPRPRPHRGDGRHPDRRGHPRRRAHHDRLAARCRRARPAARPGRGARGRTAGRWGRRDPRPGRRRRAADRPRAARSTCAPAATTSTPPPTPPPASRWPRQRPPDLVILDLGLPDMDGSEVIAGLRGWTTAPIIVLTGRTDQPQKIAALDAGADDYVTKPFGIEELFARMRAVARRVTGRRRRARGGDRPLGRRPRHPPGPSPRRRPARTSGSPRPSGASSSCSSATPAAWSPSSSCSPRSGGRPTRRRPTTCGSTWPSCAASSNPTRATPATC